MVEELTTLAGLPLAYHWSGLSPDDEPLLLSNAGSSRMYALTPDLTSLETVRSGLTQA